MSRREELYGGTSLVRVKPDAICDTECYPNFWSIGFKRVRDGKLVVLEKSHRQELDVERLATIMATHRIITYNGGNYDLPMIAYALTGATNAQLKAANDRIIIARLRPWQAEEAFGFKISRKWTHIDLMPVSPSPPTKSGGESFPTSLKTLQGRLHGQKMQDLPYEPDTPLTEAQMDVVLSYMGNDLDATHNLFDALQEPLELRAALGAEYGLDLMSKSDAQCGEAMIKRRVEQLTGERVFKENTPAGTSFPFKVPDWFKVEHPELKRIAERLATSEFIVRADGKVENPAWLDDCTIEIGGMPYSMGIGGLHSTERERALYSDDDHVLYDFDVASYYAAIILNSGLYPRSMGRAFLEVFRMIRDERVKAKRRAKEIDDLVKVSGWTDELRREKAAMKTKEKGLKIALNGCFGKLGSPFSVLYAPHLMIAITLGGQLALLMLIDRAVRAGIGVVSGNTDGVVFRCPRHLGGPIERDRLVSGALKDIVEQWEADTGFELEATEYQALYNANVNRYIAIKPDGKAKRKGKGLVSPRAPGEEDLRTQLMVNRDMEVCSNAVVEYLVNGTPLEETIRACIDVRDFLTVVNVAGGGTWAGKYLGKVVRYYWAKDGEEIFYKKANASTGNHKKVSSSEGCEPLMDLTGAIPANLDYDRYVARAKEILMEIGADKRPPPIKPLRIFKYNAIGWFAVAV